MESPRFAPLSDRHSLWSWLAQLVGAALIPIAFEFFEGSALGWSEVASSPFGAIGIQVFNPIVIIALAFAAGGVVPVRLREKGARWIWTVPCALLFIAVIWDLYDFHNWHLIWVEYFYWSRPGSENIPIGRDLLTYPALSAVAYSAAAALIAKSRNARRPGS